MNCFPCFQSQKSKRSNSREFDENDEPVPVAKAKPVEAAPNKREDAGSVDISNITAKSFTFRELAAATKNFRQEFLLCDSGFGRLYKGTLQPSGQVVAVKQLDRNGTQGNKEFLVEVQTLSFLNHENLINLVGYCADGDQRLLVYEYMPLGSLAEQLHEVKEDKKPLDWKVRMNIAYGAAQGLEYLHEKADPPVIFRDMKSSNILLDEAYNPKLADVGIDKLGASGNKMPVAPRVIGTYGYSAPEYERGGELTLKSDIYSFGVILLELITGRKAVDTTRPADEQNLVVWAQAFFKDPKRFPEMADPLLGNRFPVRNLNQAVGIAAMCLQDEPSVRPLVSDIIAILSFLAMAPEEPAPPAPEPAPAPEAKPAQEPKDNHDDDGGESSDDDGSDNGSDHHDEAEDGEDEAGSDDDGGDSANDSGSDTESHNGKDGVEEQQKEGKKTITWNLDSMQLRKMEDEDEDEEDDGSSSSSSRRNSNVGPEDKDCGPALERNGTLGSGNKSYSSDSGSSSSDEDEEYPRDKSIGCDSRSSSSKQYGKMDSGKESVGSDSGSSSSKEYSKMDSRAKSIGSNSRTGSRSSSSKKYSKTDSKAKSKGSKSRSRSSKKYDKMDSGAKSISSDSRSSSSKQYDKMDSGVKSISSDSRSSSMSESVSGSFRSTSGRVMSSSSVDYTEYEVGNGDPNLTHTTSCLDSSLSIGSNNESVSSY